MTHHWWMTLGEAVGVLLSLMLAFLWSETVYLKWIFVGYAGSHLGTFLYLYGIAPKVEDE